MGKWESHLDELKSLRDEINWRVKIAYTSSAVFISVMGALIGALTQKDYNEIIIKNNGSVVILGLLFALLIAMFIGIINSNHIVEKRIELYSLNLQKAILVDTTEPIYSWLSYLYGHKNTNSMFFTYIEKIFSGGVAIFQYVLPNFLAILILIILNSKCNACEGYPFLFTFVCILVGIAICSTLYLAYFVSIVNKEHTEFYKDHVEKYFNTNNEFLHEAKNK